MELITQTIREALLRNGRIRLSADVNGSPEIDFYPVVKLFTSDAGCTWLLTELDPQEPDICPGFAAMRVGFAGADDQIGETVSVDVAGRHVASLITRR